MPRAAILAYGLGGTLLGLLLLPLFGLLVGTSGSALLAELKGTVFQTAFWLTLKTSSISLLFVVCAGTPLAWWLTRTASPGADWVQGIAYVPVLLPPAVLGVALLFTFGGSSVAGVALSEVGIRLPFTRWAVILAQVIVSAPFYLVAATNAFRRVDDDVILVARTLGETSAGAFFRVAVPVALPGLLGGAALAWARAAGEFGATLLFAGNQPGETQTLPLAIYSALETDVARAVALAILLVVAFAVVLGLFRFVIAHQVSRRRRGWSWFRRVGKRA